MKALLVPLLALSAPVIALACIHAPKGYKGKPSEQEKSAFLFHDGANAHLVLRTTLVAEGGLPGSMAWVIPLPSLPSRYEEVSGESFAQLERLTIDPEAARLVAAPAQKVAVAPAPGIRVHAAQVVGSYAIQPIEILDASAGGELNAWLARNGFSTVPPENQKFYLKKGAAFVALRVGGLKGGAAALKPLHVVYRDEGLRLPIKFSTHSGVFDVTLYTLTSRAPAADALAESGFRRGASLKLDGSQATRAPDVAKLIGTQTGFITAFRAEGFNHRCLPAAQLEEDPWLAPDGRGSERMTAAARSARAKAIGECRTEARLDETLKDARALEATDMPAAMRRYEQAARSGNALAALRLGQIYERGATGVPASRPDSLKWYNAARVLGAEIPGR